MSIISGAGDTASWEYREARALQPVAATLGSSDGLPKMAPYPFPVTPGAVGGPSFLRRFSILPPSFPRRFSVVFPSFLRRFSVRVHGRSVSDSIGL